MIDSEAVCDIDHGTNCFCISCPCLRHKGCQKCCDDLPYRVNSGRVMESRTENSDNYKIYADGRRKAKAEDNMMLGSRLDGKCYVGKNLFLNSENRDKYRTAILPVISSKTQTEPSKYVENFSYQPGKGKFYSNTTSGHDFPVWKVEPRPPKTVAPYVNQNGIFDFQTTLREQYRDFGRQPVDRDYPKPVIQVFLKSASRFDSVSTNHADYQTWNKYTRPRSRPVYGVYNKEEDRDFLTSTGTSFKKPTLSPHKSYSKGICASQKIFSHGVNP
ncbi:hypothetical protein HDU92_001931 [Lobulomyces angularis]|nr:hypothetical protein HDU92_001931 [Lobulomyces angularis]